MTELNQNLADLILVLHLVFVLFVIAGLLLIVVGGFRGWRWVRNRWFRFAHLGGIGIVVVQSWLGLRCPLTNLEMWLRSRSGGAQYDGSLIQHWVRQVLYYDAPGWVFGIVYTIFGLLVIVVWVRFPPHNKSN